MKQYFKGYVCLPLEKFVPRVTEKAIAFTIAGGYTTANDKIEWFPKSQIIIGEPNDVGVAEILIPYWIIKQKTTSYPVDYFERIREIRTGSGEKIVVER